MPEPGQLRTAATGGDVRLPMTQAGPPHSHARTRRGRGGHRLLWWSLAVTGVIAPVAIIPVLVGSHRETSRYRGDPFSGVQLFVDPNSPAAEARRALARSDPPAATLLRKIASQPTGIWLGSWLPAGHVATTVHAVMSKAAGTGSMPLFVLYAFPYRGCGRAVDAGTARSVVYRNWIAQVVAAIGTGRAAVILEPDALAEFFAQPGCLPPTAWRNGLRLLRQAVDQFVRSPNIAVYIDAGHSHWRSVTVMARLLLAVDVRKARGFALNVSNFNSTAAEESYGDALSALVNGAHFVVDTSRNGAASAKTWCNPPDQALGVPPTTHTGDPLADAFLWIKPPGASDGPCGGGPPAGRFWLSYALGLAAKARW